MKKLLITAALLISAIAGFCQSDETANIKKAALYYLEGFYEGDTVKLQKGISTNLYKYGYWRDNKTNKYGGEQMTYRQAVDYTKGVLKKKNFAKPEAPKKVLVLDIEEQVAAAKVTAWWGVDYLLLAKHDGEWVIEQVLWQGPLK